MPPRSPLVRFSNEIVIWRVSVLALGVLPIIANCSALALSVLTLPMPVASVSFRNTEAQVSACGSAKVDSAEALASAVMTRRVSADSVNGEYMAPSPSCTVLAPYRPCRKVDADAVAAPPAPGARGSPMNDASAEAVPLVLDDEPAPNATPPWCVSVNTWPGAPL